MRQSRNCLQCHCHIFKHNTNPGKPGETIPYHLKTKTLQKEEWFIFPAVGKDLFAKTITNRPPKRGFRQK